MYNRYIGQIMMTEFSTLLESNFYDGLGFSIYYFYVCLICNADKECRRSPKGDGFVGSKFSDDKECQKWESYLVQDAIAKDGYTTQTSANLDNNYCRNPLLHRVFEDGSIEVQTRRRALVLLAVQWNRKGNGLQCSLLRWGWISSHFNFFWFILRILKSLLIIDQSLQISILIFPVLFRKDVWEW